MKFVREKLPVKKELNVFIPGTAWRNSSLRIYFNMSKVVKVRTKILRANIILHRGLKSFTQIPIYQASYGLILKDINSSKVLFNRTLASDGLGSLRKRYCLVPNVLNLVRRWRNYPESNQGLLLAVHDTGKYSATLQTFYPKRNIYVPALALYLKPPKIYNKVYKLIPSEAVEIIKTKT